jgi:hypothetical protein
LAKNKNYGGNMRLILFAVGLALMLLVVSYTFSQATSSGELAWWGESFPGGSFVLTVVLMLVGILFGCLFRRLVGRQEPVNVLAELGAVFRSSSFLAALCVSPFVFMSVYAVVSESPGDPASYLLSFQNGFFCETVFEQLMATKTKPG